MTLTTSPKSLALYFTITSLLASLVRLGLLPTSIQSLLPETCIVSGLAVFWYIVFKTEYVVTRVLNTVIFSLTSSALGMILTGFLPGSSVFDGSRWKEGWMEGLARMTIQVSLPELAIALIAYVIKIFIEYE